MYAGVRVITPARVRLEFAGRESVIAADRSRAIPEVEDLHEAICPEYYVCRLQVPVHDPPGMCMHERVGDLAHDLEHRVERHLAAADESGKRIARHIFHDDIRVVAIDDHIMDGSDVRMIELAQHLALRAATVRGHLECADG